MSFNPTDQVSQSGQALKMNSLALSSLSSLFEMNLGPDGSSKMLITPSGAIKVTKDGSTLLKEIQFAHPTAIVMKNMAASLSNEVGDGTTSFVVFTSKIFLSAVKFINEGASIHKIIEELEKTKQEIMNWMKEQVVPLPKESIPTMIEQVLATKISDYKNLAQIITKAMENIDKTDTNMIEVMKMGEGEVNETRLINGLVLDHGGRHTGMPLKLEDCAILITNISLEYEKPEINSSFYYSTSEEREKIVEMERNFILERAEAISRLSLEVKKLNKNLVVISEKGIDPYSLEILAKNGILGLRRAKRRNMERLSKMCEAKLVTRIEELKLENLGFAQKVTQYSIGDDKFTFVEGTPSKQSCTILVRGNNDLEMERIISAIKSAIKSVNFALQDGVYLRGGIEFYYNLSKFLSKPGLGFKIMNEAILEMMKVLIRNKGKIVVEELTSIESGNYEFETVFDNFCVLIRVMSNSITAAMNFLLVDEIIRAGRPVKEENKKEQ